MKKLKLFVVGTLLSLACNVMAQTVTLTAIEAANKNGGWTLQVQAPQDIAGWQMLLNLPEGLTIDSSDLTIGDATYTKYDVTLPEAYGDKYAVVGTKTTKGGYFLFCFPVADTYTKNDLKKVAGSGNGNMCTINLKATKAFTKDPECTVTFIATSDEKGVSTDGEDTSLSVMRPLGDATGDYRVDLNDILRIIRDKVSGEYVESSDVNNDGKVDLNDILFVIKKKTAN